MAKKSSEEYLAGILNLLDDVIKENKKAAKSVGASNVPNVSIFAADAANIKVLGDSLKILSSAIEPLAKIPNNKIEAIAKNLTTLGQAIRSFGLDKEAFQAVGNMIGAFTQIHNTISSLSENFMQSILKFNPIKGRILGRILGRFYGNVLKGMRMGLVKNMVKIFKYIPSTAEDPAFKSRVVNFGLMIGELLLIDKEKIMQLWFMGTMLGPRIGKAIGGFFKELIEKLTHGDPKGSKAAAAAKIILSISTLIGVLTLSLVALVLLFKNNDWQDLVGGGAMLIGVVALSLRIIKILGSPKFNREANKALKGTKQVLALIGGLIVSLIALVLLAKISTWEEIGKGAVILGGIVIMAITITWLLGKFNRKKNQALTGVGSILLLIGGLMVVALLVKNFAKDWKDISIGMGMMFVFTLASIALLWLLSTVAKSKTRMLNSLIGVGVIIALTVGMSFAMMAFIKYLNTVDEKIGLNKEGWKKIGTGAGMMGAIIGGVLGVVALLAAISLIPGAKLFLATGAVMLGAITGIIFAVTETVDNFVDLIERIHNLSQSDINDAVDKIIGKSGVNDEGISSDDSSLLGALSSIITGMSQFSKKAIIKTGAIGIALKPLISSIADFVDVVQKMASLKIADEWDPKTGKVTHYLQLTPEAFKEAAKNLTESFTTFLTELSNGMAGFDIKSIAIIDILFPRQSKLSKKLTGEKPGIGSVIHMLGDFIDIIQKMASLSVPDKWDENGKPIGYKQLTAEQFGVAATTLSDAFGNFISKLGEGLKSVGLKSAIALEVLSGPLSDLLPGISSIMNPIMQIAAGKLQVGDKTYNINLENMQKAGGDVVSVIKSLIHPLSELKAKNIDKDDIMKVIDSFSYSLDAFGKFADSFVFKKEFESQAEYAKNGFTKFTEFLSNHDFSKLQAYAEDFEDMLDYIRDGIVPFVNKIKINQFDEAFKDYCTNMINGFDVIANFINNEKFKGAGLLGDDIVSRSNNFEKVIKNITTGIKTFMKDIDMNNFGDNIFVEYCEAMKNGFDKLADFINNKKFDSSRGNDIVSRSNNFVKVMKNTAAGVKSIEPYLKTTPAQIVELANALKQLDEELLEKEERRTKAIQSVSSNFKDMATNIQMLNKSLNDSLKIMDKYNNLRTVSSNIMQTKGAEAIVQATTQVKDTVKDAFASASNVNLNESNNQNLQNLSMMIASAITESLNNWSKQNKDITIKFDQSSKAIFGSVEMG